MRMYELIDMFNTVQDVATLRELSDTRMLDSDTIDQISRLPVGQTADLAGYEGAVMVRRVE